MLWHRFYHHGKSSYKPILGYWSSKSGIWSRSITNMLMHKHGGSRRKRWEVWVGGYPKDFVVIQNARQALRALRTVVRLRAIFRSRQVRKQAAVTLRNSEEGKSLKDTLDEQFNQADPVKQAEHGWCDNPGTVTEVRAKLQMRPRSSATPYSRGNKTPKDVRHQKVDKNNSGWSWLEKRMAQIQSVPSEVIPPYSRRSDGNVGFYPFSSEQNSVKVRRNNVTTRVSARPRTASPITRSSSAPRSDSVQDDTSGSNSSTSSTLVFGNYLKVENVEEANVGKAGYMNLTQSTMVKQRTSNCSNIQRHPMEEYHYHNKSMGFFSDDTRSNDGSDLYPPVVACRAERVRYQ
ncbi:protein IQ-DOMAIN 1-like [Pyrus ussuriensis x Pyrus communis]|uniref:Protein IQ-DOMAIN 1-like n=1 Tax=Pyrus ussuriensis x Pyrus communis TaxID=2448454 RepID=A0A5N5G7N2_9ROSA|nr:protein IQ-DOMAIN 1-like [Pyrus ussuriensis x Pyrus communis]